MRTKHVVVHPYDEKWKQDYIDKYMEHKASVIEKIYAVM